MQKKKTKSWLQCIVYEYSVGCWQWHTSKSHFLSISLNLRWKWNLSAYLINCLLGILLPAWHSDSYNHLCSMAYYSYFMQYSEHCCVTKYYWIEICCKKMCDELNCGPLILGKMSAISISLTMILEWNNA